MAGLTVPSNLNKYRRPISLITNVGLGLAAIYWLTEHVSSVVAITGRSMSPTLNPTFHETGHKDYVLVNKYGPFALHRGMIVTFSRPSRNDGSIAVKRITGLHGDTISSRNGEKIVIPRGHVWVEGDNMDNSHDSNDFGPISARLIQGHITSIVLPFRRAGRLRWESWQPKVDQVEARPENHEWPEEWRYGDDSGGYR